jgi:hypothetical protein
MPNKHSSGKQRPDRRLVPLDGTNDLLRLVCPAILLRALDSFKSERRRFHVLLNTIDLIAGETIVPGEEVACGNVEVALGLCPRL